ncbi:N-acetylmuramoyl-L-alanine amidase [Thalassorhabdomicrobium marinisediminis]|nr:N-acetylmuramoyl-L-alanine amidase [Thalassorhabdomicrobium marinisediminis]
MSLFGQMKGTLGALCLIGALGLGPVQAQDFSGLARLDVAQSGAVDQFRSTELTLYLSQPVPYRVFTLDAPRRLVLDFREVDFRQAKPDAFTASDWIGGARFGVLRPGWSRMVLDLSAPVAVDLAGMRVDASTGTATITVALRRASEAEFAAAAGAPDDPDWALLSPPEPVSPAPRPDGPLVVMIDPGHGGIDPGAGYDDVHEADVMLALARELASALGRVEGVRPVLTRNDDRFVPLQERLTLARQAGAGLFISLHADALEGQQATGASVYTLTDAAEEDASLRMVERHESGDLLAGVDLSGQGDEVATVLQDLVRVETAAAGERFATGLVQAMRDTGAQLNSRPRREAELAVLNAADFPSVLLEVGFLSNAQDRARLTSPTGRAPIVAAVTLAVARWAIEEEALAPLLRQ